MIDVLLAHSFFLKHDPKQQARQQPYAPLATLYAAAILRREGYEVALFDATLAESVDEFAALLHRHRPRFVVLYEDSFNFLVKMCLGRQREAAQQMSELARESGATVIAAGPDVTDHPAAYFAHGVQYGLVGEADHTLVELLDALTGRDPRPLPEIAGLALPDPDSPGGVCLTPKREPERHLDCFPLPAWDLLDAARYRAAWRAAHGRYSVNMVTTRGCPFHCNWCAKPIWGQRYALRSPASVADEMALLKRTLHPDHLWFADDIFGLRGQWVGQFGQEVALRNAHIPFTIQSRADLMTEKTVEALALAGCEEVWLGAESGSQKVLDAMDKGITVAQIGAARARLKAAGIRANFFIQLGYPGETFDEILATTQMIREVLPDKIGVSVSYPLPGTRFYEMVRAQLGPKTNWDDSGDLAMMFQGAYGSSFYRHLHRLLHSDLTFHQRLAAAPPDTETRRELAALTAQWFALGQLEATERSTTPTLLERPDVCLALPDLEEDWN